MMLKRSAVMAAILLTAGCAAQADLNYRKPTQPSLTNSRTVNAGFEETWDGLVRNLSSEFFVINNIEKASRIINVSRSEEHTSELQSLMRISYAVFCLKKKKL